MVSRGDRASGPSLLLCRRAVDLEEREEKASQRGGGRCRGEEWRSLPDLPRTAAEASRT
jgi:hypothetical protein